MSWIFILIALFAAAFLSVLIWWVSMAAATIP